MIRRGNRIRIIHTVSRRLGEVLASISWWMPLYMTGKIEPYYYPKKRDGIYRRTMMIAPEIGAIVSNSVGDMEGCEAITVIWEEKGIEAAMKEFSNYFALCRPLMQVIPASHSQELLTVFSSLDANVANSFMLCNGLSIMTLPNTVLRQMTVSLEPREKKGIQDYYRIRKENFKKSVRNHKFTEILRLPELASIREGKAKLPFVTLSGVEGLAYTPEQYRQHLESVVSMLKKYDNYHVQLNPGEDNSMMIYVKEEYGVMVMSSTAVFFMDESHVTVAFENYLKKIFMENQGLASKKKTIAFLEDLIKELA